MNQQCLSSGIFLNVFGRHFGFFSTTLTIKIDNIEIIDKFDIIDLNDQPSLNEFNNNQNKPISIMPKNFEENNSIH